MNNAKKKSIIHEPGAEHEFNHTGFLIGSMGNLLSKYELARHYKTSADDLVDVALEYGEGNYIYGYPVLFLYRHAIELALKSLVDNSYKYHNYSHLMNKFREAVEKHFNEKVPDWFNNWFEQINQLDPKSTAFRYGEVPSDELWVSFIELKEIVEVMFVEKFRANKEN
jgi:hypothetical protein